MLERLLAFVSGATVENPPPPIAEIPAPEIPRGEQLRAELHEVTAELSALDQDVRVFLQFHSVQVNRFQQIVSCTADSFEHRQGIELAWKGFLGERDVLMRRFTAIQAEGSAFWSHHA
jgi:hypothetical protein